MERHFENKDLEIVLKVIEKSDYLDVPSASLQVGKGYLFAFCKDAGLGYDSESVCFYVVDAEFFKENGHLDSVQFTEEFDMPECYEEVAESCFVVEDGEDAVRKDLLSMGFTESRALKEKLSEDIKRVRSRPN